MDGCDLGRAARGVGRSEVRTVKTGASVNDACVVTVTGTSRSQSRCMVAKSVRNTVVNDGWCWR